MIKTATSKEQWIVTSKHPFSPVRYILAESKNKARSIYSKATGEPYVITQAIKDKPITSPPF